MDDDDDILFLLRDNKRLTSVAGPEPQFIAVAIAAFALNNMLSPPQSTSECLEIIFGASAEFFSEDGRAVRNFKLTTEHDTD